jgi:hypothetical protein
VAGSYGKKIFGLGNQTFSTTDANGTFSAQVTYVSGGKLFAQTPVAFGFFRSPVPGPRRDRDWVEDVHRGRR